MLPTLSMETATSRPWLLCVDLQREFVALNRPLCARDADAVAESCKAVLAGARRANWHVAHIHTRRSGALFGKSSAFTRPIVGLEPWTSEPLFFRSGLSIFSSQEVLALARGAREADFHLIGFSAGGSCLATIFAGFDLGIHLTLVDDAIGAAGSGATTLRGINEIVAPLCSTIGSSDLIRYMERADAQGR